MTTETTVEAAGADLTAVLADAAQKLDAYYGHTQWQIVLVQARPMVELVGEKIPALWFAEVTAQADL